MLGMVGECLLAVAYNNTPQHFVGKILQEKEKVRVSFMKQMEGNSFLWPTELVTEDVEKEQVFEWNVRETHDHNNPKCFIMANKHQLDGNARKCYSILLAARRRTMVSNSFCMKRRNNN